MNWKNLGATVLIVVALLVGFNSLIVQPQIAEVQSEGRGLNFPSELQDVRVSGDAALDKSLTVAGAASFAGANSFTGASNFSAAVDVTPTLSIGSVNFSGPLRYGSAASVVSGTQIAHGFGTTPTMFIPRNYGGQATTFTQTLYAFNCGAISCTIGVGSGSILTFTINWVAGK